MSIDHEQNVIKAAVKWTYALRWDDSAESTELRNATVEYLGWINGGTLIVSAATGAQRREHSYGPHSSGGAQ